MGKSLSRIKSWLFREKFDTGAGTEIGSNLTYICKGMNTTGCEITIKGKLLLVLDTKNDTMQTFFSCFTELVISRLNNTNVTSEVLNGASISTGFTKENPMNVDKNLLRNKLTNLSSEFSAKDNEAGMAIILSDQGLTSENFTDIPDDGEPFLFFVNVGQNENDSRSCFRQHRFIRDITKLEDFGQEIESIGCDGGKSYMQQHCPQLFTTPTPKSPSTESSHSNGGETYMQESYSPLFTTPTLQSTDNFKVVGMPLVVGSVVGALLLAVLIIVYLVFRPKCRREGKSKRNTFMESSAVDNEFGGYSLPQNSESRVSSKNNDVYNVLWEKEMREADKNDEDNYHHMDLHFVKGNVDPSLYDVAGGIREDLDEVFKPPD